MLHAFRGFPGGSVVKNSQANSGNAGLIPGSGRFHGEGNGNPLQYSCLFNPMDRGTWWATVHGVAKNWTLLSDLNFHLSLICDPIAIFLIIVGLFSVDLFLLCVSYIEKFL